MATYDWAVTAFWGPRPAETDASDGSAPAAETKPAAVFVVFDLETTGLDPKKERIVEIGAVKFDRRGPIGRFSVLIDPQRPMPPEASKVNGITDSMLKGKPDIAKVMPDFLRFIEGAVLVAHNAPFDCSFVDAALADAWAKSKSRRAEDVSQGSLLGSSDEEPAGGGAEEWVPPFPALPNKVVDTRIFAKEAFPGRPKYSLQELARQLGIEALDAHRAEDDARVCMELFVRCAEKAGGGEARNDATQRRT